MRYRRYITNRYKRYIYPTIITAAGRLPAGAGHRAAVEILRIHRDSYEDSMGLHYINQKGSECAVVLLLLVFLYPISRQVNSIPLYSILVALGIW